MDTKKAQQTADQVDKKLMSHLAPLEQELSKVFYDKAPRLPKELAAFLVQITPFVTIVLVALFGLGLVRMLVGPVFPFSSLFDIPAFAFNYNLYILVSLVGWLLLLAAVPGLLKHQKSGWNFLFYFTLWNIVTQLMSTNVIMLIVSLAISFYFLFQVRPFYTHALAGPKV